LTPEEIAARAGEPQAPELRLPDPGLEFDRRRARLEALAAGHPMREYLLFVAAIARAQQAAVNGLTSLSLPGAPLLQAGSDPAAVPLPAASWPRDPQWRDSLRGMLARLEKALGSALGSDLNAVARESVRRLAAESDAFFEAQADRLLAGITVGLDLAAAPLIGAALQVYWVRLVADVAERHGLSVFSGQSSQSLCPCCGARPTASIVRMAGVESGTRYLHCSLCSAQWHLVRIKCTHCLGTKGIHYQALGRVDSELDSTGSDVRRHRAPVGVVRAECCDECDHYLKILSMEQDPEVEPVADDLATVALDLLLSQAGRTSAGVNLMLLYGDPGDG